MSAARALSEIAYVAGELHAVREAGFTGEALKYPRSEAGLVALCAFNGISPEQAPPGWRYWPNAGMKACWERVIEAMWEHAVLAIEIEAQRATTTQIAAMRSTKARAGTASHNRERPNTGPHNV